MVKEYLVALFPRKRRVMINGQFMGFTNTKLELERGPYEVTLGPPKNDQACADLISAHCPEAPRPFPFAADLDPYIIEINFEATSQLPGEDPRYYLDLPTSFKLNKEQVANLVAIGPKLMQAAPQYRCLLKVLAAEAEGRPRPKECPVGAGIFPFQIENVQNRNQ
jgi:hypothetical protein